MDAKTKTLLKIVKTWNLSKKPEYRGFRCANCQKYMRKVYYYWLDGSGYLTPVHFCKECQKKFESSEIQITKPRLPVNRKTFGLDFGEEIIQMGRNIIKKWKIKAKPKYKIFTCDNCGKNMYKAYHTWLNIKNRLVEIHFCKKCGDKLKLVDEAKASSSSSLRLGGEGGAR